MALLKHLDPKRVSTIVISVGTKPGSDTFYQLLVNSGYAARHVSVAGRLNPHIILALRKSIQEEGAEILHTHGFKADVLGYLATRGMAVTVVSTMHGWNAQEGMRIRIYEAVSKFFLRQFHRLYPLSPALYAHLCRNGFDAKRIKLILNGVDLSSIEFNPTKRSRDEPFSILFVGRICRPKGIFDLLEALALAKFDTPSKLTIVGDGPDHATVIQVAEKLGITDRIQLVGAVPSINDYLKANHVLVLPSYSEGIPRVVMEAFAAGIPVIGTAIEGIQQLVEHNVTGLLTPVGDIPSLAERLETVCRHPEMSTPLLEAARKLVCEKFSAQRMAKDFEAEYFSLCAHQ